MSFASVDKRIPSSKARVQPIKIPINIDETFWLIVPTSSDECKACENILKLLAKPDFEILFTSQKLKVSGPEDDVGQIEDLTDRLELPPGASIRHPLGPDSDPVPVIVQQGALPVILAVGETDVIMRLGQLLEKIK